MKKAAALVFAILIYCDTVTAQPSREILIKLHSINLDSSNIKSYAALAVKLKNELPDSALFYYQKIISFCRKNKLLKGLGFYDDMSNIEAERGNYNSALELNDSAMKYTHLFNKKNIGSCFMHKANILQSIGNYEQAMEEYLNALKFIDEKTNPKDASLVCSNMTVLLNNAGKSQLALEYCEKQLSLAEKYNQEGEIAFACANYSQAWQGLNNMEKARPYILRLYEIAIRRTNPDLKVTAFNNMGILSMHDSDYEGAVTFYLKAVELNEKLADNYMLCYSLNNLASAYQKLNQPEKAKQYLERALSLSIQISAKEARKETYQLLGVNAVMSNDYKTAFRFSEIVVKLNDSLLNEKSQQTILDLETKYKSQQIKQEKELKEQQVLLLQKDVALKQIDLNKNEQEAINSQNRISLLSKDKEIQKLELIKNQTELAEQKLIAKNKSDEIKLKEEELRSERTFLIFLVSVFVTLVIISGLLFNRFKLKRKIEQQQALLAERHRISHDMHDDLGSSLSKIAFLSDSVLQNNGTAEVKAQLRKISSSAREAIEKAGEIIWWLNPQNDTLENFVAYLRKYAAEYFEHSNIQCHFNLPSEIPDVKISGEQRRNIFLAAKEALHNVMKHAGATRIDFSILQNNRHLEIHIHDNGKGINLKDTKLFSNGLKTMKLRTEAAGGHFSIENGRGTTVRLGMELTEA